ncbi:uncharacterized protein [Dysidea avara]|uniref:uncharacterized protein isoform X2 n=1 Tax=Dysidea avara TaxID=196820 RepID=UPI00332039F7
MVNYKLLVTIILWSLVKKAICVTDIVFRSLIEDAQLDISSDHHECFWYYRCPLEDNSRLLTSVAGSDLTLDNDSDIGEYFCWDQQSENTDKLVFVHRGQQSECGYCMKPTLCQGVEGVFVRLETFVQPGIFNLSKCKLVKNGRTICDNIGIMDCENPGFTLDDHVWTECELNSTKIIITSTKQRAGSMPTTSCLSTSVAPTTVVPPSSELFVSPASEIKGTTATVVPPTSKPGTKNTDSNTTLIVVILVVVVTILILACATILLVYRLHSRRIKCDEICSFCCENTKNWNHQPESEDSNPDRSSHSPDPSVTTTEPTSQSLVPPLCHKNIL